MSLIGVNLVDICHFGENVKNWEILGAKMTHTSKFGENCQIIFCLNVSKNDFRQVYGHNLGQKFH